MSRPISDPVFDIGRDLQRAYDEGYKQDRYDEKVEAETFLPSWEQTHACDLIKRQDAIYAIVNTVSDVGLHDNSETARYGATFRQHEIITILKSLPSAQPETCEGCKHLGKWENEVEYGYPSPCTSCKRRVEDHYER